MEVCLVFCLVGLLVPYSSSQTAQSTHLEIKQVCTGNPLDIECPHGQLITVTNHTRIVSPVYPSRNQCWIRSDDMACCRRHCPDMDDVIGRTSKSRAESCTNETMRCYRPAFKTSGHCSSESYKNDLEEVSFTCTAKSSSAMATLLTTQPGNSYSTKTPTPTIQASATQYVVNKSKSTFPTPTVHKTTVAFSQPPKPRDQQRIAPILTTVNGIEIQYGAETVSQKYEEDHNQTLVDASALESTTDNSSTGCTLIVLGVISVVGVVGLVGFSAAWFSYSRKKRSKTTSDNPTGVESASEFHSLDGATGASSSSAMSQRMSRSKGQHAKSNIYEGMGKSSQDYGKNGEIEKMFEEEVLAESVYEEVEPSMKSNQ